MDTIRKIDDAIEFIHKAHDELKKGNVVLLSEFEQHVKSIHNEIAQAAPENPEIYAEKLDRLATSVRDFEVDLRAMQIDVKYELTKLSQKQKAAKSYQFTNHAGKDKPEEN